MLVRCPSCATKFDLAQSRFDADGTMISCAACGHDWIEGRAVEVSSRQMIQLPSVAEHGFEPDYEVRRLVDATRDAQDAFAVRKRKRQALAAAWFGLAVLAGSPAVAALAFPETLVRAAPATIALYDWMGREVNIYGLDIRKVEMEHLLVDGKRIIAVKGEVANVAGAVRKIPWLRFGLLTGSRSEVYSWQLDTYARPLNPGESTSFVTRIASPPEDAEHLEIRFARAEEIGSNAAP